MRVIPADIVSHGGRAVARDKFVFFRPPPDSIGRLLSANSSLTPNHIAEARQPQTGVARLFSKFRKKAIHTCTYVGEHGIAGVTTRDAGASVKIKELRFTDATELWAEEANVFVNGNYTKTTFSFRWVDKRHLLFTINGSYTTDFSGCSPSHLVHFGRAAERAWTNHYLKRCEAARREGDVIEFRLQFTKGMPCRSRGGIWLSKDYIEVQGGGVFSLKSRLNRDEIRSANTDKGFIVIQERDAKEGFFDQGIHRFPYQPVAKPLPFGGYGDCGASRSRATDF